MDDARVYAVVLPLGPLALGVPLARASWPLHVTVVPGVRTSAGLDLVVGIVREAARRIAVQKTTVGEPALFGPEADIPVDLVHDALRPIHAALLDALHTGADAIPVEPAYNREGYRPHITATPTARARRGEQLTLDTIAVAVLAPDGDADSAVPLAVFDLASGAVRPVPGTMDAASVIAISDALTASRVRHWLIGGWGVDALLGTQARDHHDLDLLVHADDATALLEALKGLRSTVRYVWSESRPLPGSGLPSAFVADGPLGELDVHVVSLDGDRPVPQWADAPTLPPGAFAVGTILDRAVPCVTADAQLALHSGYDLPLEQQKDVERVRSQSLATPARSFLILHGWDNFRPEGHWQHALAVALRARGERVEYPQLPDAAHPSVGAWREALAESLVSASADGARVVVIAHSLACLLWLGARPVDADALVERVLLVAPPSPAVVRDIPEIAAFAGLEPAAPAEPTAPLGIVASDADPYCPEGAEAAFGPRLGCPVTIIPGGGHLEPSAGYGVWPSMLAWALDPAAPLVANRR